MDFRPITSDELEEFNAALSFAFGHDPKDEWKEFLGRVLELDRTIAVIDGGEIVGTAGALTYEMTVPGGPVDTAGVTVVSVRPSHRRRGLLSSMMRRQLDDVRERGEPLAALWASEAPIYGRFGYGLAADTSGLKIESRHGEFAPPVDVPGQVRIVTADEAAKSVPDVHARVAVETPGFVLRSQQQWQDVHFWDPESERKKSSAVRWAVYEEDGTAHGYVSYRTAPKWEDQHAQGVLRVSELMAATPDAYAALWRFVLDVDLMETVKAEMRPAEEPLRWLLADQRRLQRRGREGLWVRLVDVPGALAARRYSIDGAVVLDVHDEFCPWNEGRYRLEVDDGGVRCRSTEEDPDVTLSAGDLAALYLGAERVASLAWAGRLTGSAAALARLGAMFRWDPAPWCPEFF